MALTVNAKSYTADSYGPNAVGYVGPSNTGSVKDLIRLARTAAKASATYSGTNRYQLKATRTHTLTGAVTSVGDSIFDGGFNLPFGMAAADIDTLCADLGAYIASAEFKTLLKAMTISK